MSTKREGRGQRRRAAERRSEEHQHRLGWRCSRSRQVWMQQQHRSLSSSGWKMRQLPTKKRHRLLTTWCRRIDPSVVTRPVRAEVVMAELVSEPPAAPVLKIVVEPVVVVMVEPSVVMTPTRAEVVMAELDPPLAAPPAPKMVVEPVVVVMVEPSVVMTLSRAEVVMAELDSPLPAPPAPKMVVDPVVVVMVEPSVVMTLSRAEVVMAELDAALPAAPAPKMVVDPVVVVMVEPPVVTTPTSAEVVIAELEAVSLDLAQSLSAPGRRDLESGVNSLTQRKRRRHRRWMLRNPRVRLWTKQSVYQPGCCDQSRWTLTLAVGGAEADDLLGILAIATGLVGAVTDAVPEVGHGAVAGDVAGGASKVGRSDANHVADTRFLAGELATRSRWTGDVNSERPTNAAPARMANVVFMTVEGDEGSRVEMVNGAATELDAININLAHPDAKSLVDGRCWVDGPRQRIASEQRGESNTYSTVSYRTVAGAGVAGQAPGATGVGPRALTVMYCTVHTYSGWTGPARNARSAVQGLPSGPGWLGIVASTHSSASAHRASCTLL
nr:hypothetical protein CFP56_63493 [Quercus suber]